MRVTELLEAIEVLRRDGWTVEPPRKGRTSATRIGGARRVGRPPKNGRRRKRGRPRKEDMVSS